MADAETAALLMAAQRLVALGLLAPENDPRQIDVNVEGCGFRYLVQFWTRTGVLEGSESGWHVRFDGVRGRDRGAQGGRRRVGKAWQQHSAGGQKERAPRRRPSFLRFLGADTQT